MRITYTFERLLNGTYARWGREDADAKYTGEIRAPARRSPYAYVVFMHEASHALQHSASLIEALGWQGCESHAWALALAFVSPKWYWRRRAYALHACLQTYWYGDVEAANESLTEAEDTINAMWHRS